MNELEKIIEKIPLTQDNARFINQLRTYKKGLEYAKIYENYAGNAGSETVLEYLKDCMLENKVPKILGDKRVVNVCNRYSTNRGSVVNIIIEVAKDNPKLVLKTAKVISKCKHKDDQFFDALNCSTDQDELFEDILEAYEMFSGICEKDITDEILNVRFSELDFANLIQNYDKVVNESEYPADLLESGYAMCRYKIKEAGFRRKATHRDLDIVKNTYEFIASIHKNRKSDQHIEIRSCFYSELNRAISQGKGYLEKKAMLREYCNEVKARIKQDAEELMLVK